MSNAVKHQMSVQTKINLAMLLVLGLLMLASLIYSANNERNLIQQVMEQRTRDTADTYFDFINTSMLTGTMAQRGILRDKILASPGIIEARIIRDEEINKVFGPGFDHQAPADEFDRRALNGEAIMEITETDKGRVLTVVNPIHAQKDYRGTNCLMCHQVPEDAVVGAVRISYDLSKLDAQVDRNILVSALIQLLLLVAAADPTGDVALLCQAAAHLGVAGEMLAPAEAAGLVVDMKAELERIREQVQNVE